MGNLLNFDPRRGGEDAHLETLKTRKASVEAELAELQDPNYKQHIQGETRQEMIADAERRLEEILENLEQILGKNYEQGV